MSVTTPETFKLSGGACSTNGDEIVAELAQLGITAANSSGVITITNSTLASSANGRRRFADLVRVAEAANAKLVYTVAA